MLFLDTTTPEFFTELESVFLEVGQELVPFFFQDRGKLNGKKFIVTFEDVNAEAAAALVGCEAYLPQDMLPEMEDGFYDAALIGFTAKERNGQVIGTVVEVLELSAQHLFVIETETEHRILVPAVEAFIFELNDQTRELVLELPEGLLDLNA